MCGISGIVALTAAARGRLALAQTAATISGALLHRGPDASGLWSDPQGWVAFAHRRLAIVDLSPRGEQPMRRAGGHQVICFNGEIYNFRSIRAELEAAGIEFQSGSDTEVILAATQAWGIEAALQRMDGAFVFALWDERERVLHLARDRAGEKPLLGAVARGHFLFASELRALLGTGLVSSSLDAEAVRGYLEFGYVPEPLSLVQGVFKLPAGCYTTIRTSEADSTAASARTLMIERARRYWRLPESVAASAGPATSIEDAVQRTDDILATAVREQLDCDVPVGVFLSGGIDSALVASKVRDVASRRVDAFTVKFGEEGFDESDHARQIAQHLGLAHHVLEIPPQELMNSIATEAALTDEPTANASYFPVLAMSRLARQHVTVVLSGDGGDEVFAGYNRYRQLLTLFKYRRSGLSRNIAAGVLQASTVLAGMFGRFERALLSDMPQAQLATVLSRAARFFGPAQAGDAYRATMQLLDDGELAALGLKARRIEGEPWRAAAGPLRAMLAEDFFNYLPGDNLAKVDRASMRASLEARLPLLDRELIEFACTQPDDHLIRGGQSKFLLREVLARHIPRELFERPKMGFTVPVEAWLRGPLRDWSRSLLLDRDACLDAGLEPQGVAAMLSRFDASPAVNARRIWGVAMLLAWQRGVRSGPAVMATRQLENA
ncbi:MAG TPA: asparagine synthase (glutamine-hydrolyzing) [Steroidobacter sp.]|uniref:asparagine synthase (glutamine-hydrolyzing) n=1 Tax=Steroidobacter sp. TaxID=1978227 RepID=UPI002EDA7AA0